ncbi:MAG TPA: heavy metal-binding domain-containing protein [Chitinophaga sp.]|uniref:heavy metal-binding domain-containing protein n=1 Tax=Chitinophaga sp. TaxID=1869181 RepID=UPI002BEAFCFB|nr:heavy metal-binding domain-containing protein [Chitinophaga sp.]HVI46520.1 heavy metal-binding domain-containing protein [Chitinophaga sp.]
MNESANCPNCGTKIKSGIFGSNELLSAEKCALISEMNSTPKTTGCEKCSGAIYNNAIAAFRKKREEMLAKIQQHIHHIPIVTAQNPYGWEYKTLSIVTGQSTTGTGVFAEISSSWTDFFGMQSNAYNRKIAHGESLCAQQVRQKAIQVGGNAIIAADIDYTELGAEKGMIMVAMSGTAIKLTNLDVLDKYKVDSINEISEMSEQLYKWANQYPAVIKDLEK